MLKRTSISESTGRRSSSLFQMKDELEKNAGDNIRIGLRRQSELPPKSSGTSVEGNEQTLALEYMDFNIDEYADAVRFRNVIDRQRVNFEFLDESRALLADQLANSWDRSGFNQICGVDGGYATFNGQNPIQAPSASRWIIAGAGPGEAEIVAADVLTLDHIDEAANIAKVTSPSIRPANIPGFSEDLYVCFVHPWQNYLLRQADSRWDKVMQDAMRGGMVGTNPRITATNGIWGGTLIVENHRVATPGTATDGTRIRRAAFCGAQAGICGTGRIGGTPERFRWVTKLFDYDREQGVMAGFVGGFAKTRFGDASNEGTTPSFYDFATIVISTASAANDDGS